MSAARASAAVVLDGAGRLVGILTEQDVTRRVAGQAVLDHITGLQLCQRIADFQAGRPVSNFVDPAGLTARETDLLKHGFRAINGFRDRIRAGFTGEVF